MYTKATILSTLISTSLALPTLITRQTNSWTIESFVRSCDTVASTCVYSFSINENDSTASTKCDYTIGSSPQDPHTQAYSGVGCGDHYSLNQGYDASGFIVLVATDTTSNTNAYFGYTLDEIADGKVVSPDKTSPAQSNAASKVVRRQNAGWTVSGFTRSCDDAACYYNFAVHDGSSTRECRLTDSTSPATTHSFYNTPCEQTPDLVISWGYNPTGDSAVMTVVSVAAHKDAFFGWNNINSITDLPTVGPNPSYDM